MLISGQRYISPKGNTEEPEQAVLWITIQEIKTNVQDEITHYLLLLLVPMQEDLAYFI